MMRLAFIAAAVATLFLLNGCSTKTLRVPPANLEVVTRDVIVPVLCKATVNRSKVAADAAVQGLPLEQQNAILRGSVAVLKGNQKRLESAVIGCGGTVEEEK
jgi:uncharacterized lipoprotein YajG